MGRRVSRRRLLGYGAATAALVAAAASPAAAKGEQDEILRDGRFSLDIPGCPEASENVRAVSLGRLEVELPVVGTDKDGYRAYAAGVPRWQRTKIVTRRGTKGELRRWILDAARPRKDITVTIRKKDGSAARSYTLVECFPVSYSEGDLSVGGETNVAEIVVQPSRVEPA